MNVCLLGFEVFKHRERRSWHVIMAKTTFSSLLVDQNIYLYVELKHTSSPSLNTPYSAYLVMLIAVSQKWRFS